ncbi:uncharacterized protein LOC143912557 [Arctopsyche grandis]|uniref:uncharacterized protein LOC143912557 n=1 Tax=Arctopsyche grandis TaxID=121162 RepID=UPI00406D7A3E
MLCNCYLHQLNTMLFNIFVFSIFIIGINGFDPIFGEERLLKEETAKDFNPLESERDGKQGIFNLGLSGDACISPDGIEQGICLSRQQCSSQGGRVVGSCGVFNSCCALTACDIRTSAKNSVFINPSYHTSQPYNGLECAYTVDIHNDNVCQMRIDLETFSLAQPTLVGLMDPAYSCIDDVFQVSNLQAHSEIIPPLCGENSGQHLYIRVNASLNSRSIRLSFKLADRSLNTDLTQAVWRVKVTQLECYNTMGLYKEPSLFSLNERTVNGTSDFGAREARSPATAARDHYLVAPDGCLQYYPDRFGTFESFNYNRGFGPYTGNLHYSTCFRRPIDVCGVKLQSIKFQLGFEESDNYYLDTDCEANPYVPGNVTSQDYLYIQEGESVDGLRGSKWCGISAESQIIHSAPPGHLYVVFNTDNICMDTDIEQGYRFNYNVLNNCQRI